MDNAPVVTFELYSQGNKVIRHAETMHQRIFESN